MIWLVAVSVSCGHYFALCASLSLDRIDLDAVHVAPLTRFSGLTLPARTCDTLRVF